MDSPPRGRRKEVPAVQLLPFVGVSVRVGAVHLVVSDVVLARMNVCCWQLVLFRRYARGAAGIGCSCPDLVLWSRCTFACRAAVTLGVGRWCRSIVTGFCLCFLKLLAEVVGCVVFCSTVRSMPMQS